MLSGRVFLTGGTGSLGTALLRRAHRESWPCQFTIYSRDEVKQRALREEFKDPHYVFGDVRDKDWLRFQMQGHDTVIHAAAYKQVPSSEVNASEAVKTNVNGSMNVAIAAVEAGIGHVLGISTDKACAPVNLYGMTKAVMEKLFEQACQWGDTNFTLVRYGNVLGSRGSVVPFFQRQRKQGFLTVTDPEMTRFWLTLTDATDIVLHGLQETEIGTTLVPKAPASSMLTLAKAIAPEAEIRIIGAFPGEKIHEQLVHPGESMNADDIGDYYRIYPAYTGHKGNLPQGFQYRSDTARQISVEELSWMISCHAPAK